MFVTGFATEEEIVELKKHGWEVEDATKFSSVCKNEAMSLMLPPSDGNKAVVIFVDSSLSQVMSGHYMSSGTGPYVAAPETRPKYLTNSGGVILPQLLEDATRPTPTPYARFEAEAERYLLESGWRKIVKYENELGVGNGFEQWLHWSGQGGLLEIGVAINQQANADALMERGLIQKEALNTDEVESAQTKCLLAIQNAERSLAEVAKKCTHRHPDGRDATREVTSFKTGNYKYCDACRRRVE